VCSSDLGAPLVELLDIPGLQEAEFPEPRFQLAVFASPWAGSYAALSSPTSSGFELRGVSVVPATMGELFAPLAAGPEGRWDYGSVLHVQLYSDGFESQAPELVLNGANSLAIRSDDGGWELLQFTDAELQIDGTWLLSGLLRAQLGTDQAMNAGSSVGNRIVVLNQAVLPILLETYEKGLTLNWQVGPSDDPVGSENHVSFTRANQDRARVPYSPVHLNATLELSGDTNIAWIRRSRVDSDTWENLEIPIGETSEHYQIKILDDQNQEVRQFTSTQPTIIYSATARLADFGPGPGLAIVEVSQIGSSGMVGSKRDISFSF